MRGLGLSCLTLTSIVLFMSLNSIYIDFRKKLYAYFVNSTGSGCTNVSLLASSSSKTISCVFDTLDSLDSHSVESSFSDPDFSSSCNISSP